MNNETASHTPKHWSAEDENILIEVQNQVTSLKAEVDRLRAALTALRKDVGSSKEATEAISESTFKKVNEALSLVSVPAPADYTLGLKKGHLHDLDCSASADSDTCTAPEKVWSREQSGGIYRHKPTDTIIRKNDNPTGARKWWVEGGGKVGAAAAAKGCMGGFFKLSVAKSWVEHFHNACTRTESTGN